MSPPRVLHVIGGDDTGGAMSYLLPLLTALREQGCDIHLLCLGGGGLARAAAGRGLPYTVAPMSRAWDARALAPLRRHLTASDWPVVHTHGMRANLPVRMVLPSVRPRPLLFTTIHSDLSLDYANPLKARAYGLLDRATRAGVDAFCCVSADLARRLVARGVPESRVFVVHPGIELDDLVAPAAAATLPTPGEPAGAARSPGSAASSRHGGWPLVVGTVARLVPVKDLGLLLDAVAVAARAVPEVRLVIVGDGPERAALERRAAQPDLKSRVEFSGQITPARPELTRFDIFALSSESEGIPISVLEAMAAGLPVVTAAVGGLPEIVRDGVTGYLIPRGKDRSTIVAAFANRLARLLTSPMLRSTMGEAGRKTARADFSAQAAGSTMLNIYEKALAGAKPGPGLDSRRPE